MDGQGRKRSAVDRHLWHMERSAKRARQAIHFLSDRNMASMLGMNLEVLTEKQKKKKEKKIQRRREELMELRKRCALEREEEEEEEVEEEETDSEDE